MNRDELEAVIWRQMRKTRQTLTGVTDPRADCRAVSAILAAADTYAVQVGGITAERRREAILASCRSDRQETPSVHLAASCPHPHGPGCPGPLACGGPDADIAPGNALPLASPVLTRLALGVTSGQNRYGRDTTCALRARGRKVLCR